MVLQYIICKGTTYRNLFRDRRERALLSSQPWSHPVSTKGEAPAADQSDVAAKATKKRVENGGAMAKYTQNTRDESEAEGLGVTY